MDPNGTLQKEQGTGPKREPWGTPQETDDKYYPKWTEKFPSDKYNWNYLKAVPLISTFNSSCDRDKLWSILSNVAVRSKTTRTAELLATKLKSKPLKTLRRTVSVLWGCHRCQQRNKKGTHANKQEGPQAFVRGHRQLAITVWLFLSGYLISITIDIFGLQVQMLISRSFFSHSPTYTYYTSLYTVNVCESVFLEREQKLHGHCSCVTHGHRDEGCAHTSHVDAVTMGDCKAHRVAKWKCSC